MFHARPHLVFSTKGKTLFSPEETLKGDFCTTSTVPFAPPKMSEDHTYLFTHWTPDCWGTWTCHFPPISPSINCDAWGLIRQLCGECGPTEMRRDPMNHSALSQTPGRCLERWVGPCLDLNALSIS